MCFPYNSCFSQRTGTYVLSLIKVGFYSPPTEVMNSYLRLTHMKHEPLAGLWGFRGGRWSTDDWPSCLDQSGLWMMTAVTGKKWVTGGYQVLLDQTYTFFTWTQFRNDVFSSNVYMFFFALTFSTVVFVTSGNVYLFSLPFKVLYILSFHYHLFNFTHPTESLRQQTVRLGNESRSLSGLVISESLL